MGTRTDVPITTICDVLVVGSSAAAAEAALSAARGGAKVFLASQRTFFGEDIASHYRLWLEPGETPATDLACRIFGNGEQVPSPLHVKRCLDDAVVEGGIPFLFNAFPVACLRDGSGRVAGLLMATRAGLQGVAAAAIIDATPRGAVARMAGVPFTGFAPGEHLFGRIVLGACPPEGPGCTVRPLRGTVTVPPLGEELMSANLDAFECRLRIALRDRSPLSFAAAEQEAVTRTWTPGEVLASEGLFDTPADRIDTEVETGPDSTAAFLCPGEPLFVLGGCAAVSRADAAALCRPNALMAAGERVGADAARLARKAGTKAESLELSPPPESVTMPGQVRLAGGDIRPAAVLGTVAVDLDRMPLLGTYDVAVAGGGTGGAPAGIGAARQGARTLVCEALHGLGGVATLGLIGRYYHGNRVGFTEEIDKGVAAIGGIEYDHKTTWNVRHKAAWFHNELTRAGARIAYGSLAFGAVREGDRVVGVLLATPQGAGFVSARVVVDSTGSADIAAAAGAPCIVTGAEHIAVQGTGLPPRHPAANYTNTDYTFIDDSDDLDTAQAFVAARRKFAMAFDLAQIVDSRQRRQIVGDVRIMPEDIYLGHTWADTITIAKSNFDSHGFTIHPMFLVLPPDRESWDAAVPWRCLLPRGIDNVGVTGLGISAHRDAMPILRMQPDVQNQGYALGVGAAMVAAAGTTLRQVDMKSLQRHLAARNVMPETCLAHDDPVAPTDAEIERASGAETDTHATLAVLFSDTVRARAALTRAYSSTSRPEQRLRCAQLLGIMGDATGADVLAAAVSGQSWDAGWNYRGMGQFGMSMSPLDGLVVALGCSRSPVAVRPIVDKVKSLDPESEFSHCRAVALALEALRAREAAPHLAALLGKPGMSGHAWTDLAAALAGVRESHVDNTTRTASLKELVLARALLRCGDHEGLGRATLERYVRDVRGHYSRHARAVLNEAV